MVKPGMRLVCAAAHRLLWPWKVGVALLRSLAHGYPMRASAPCRLLEKIMTQFHIAVLVGSLRRDSFNCKLANAMVKLAPPEVSFKQLSIGDLPLYNQDDDAH
jgi:hypothetical protein